MDTDVSFSPRGKFGRDLAWNVGAFGVLALSGVVLNVVMGSVYGPEALGVFSQAFALYLFASQIAALGLHLSGLKHISEHAGDTAQCRRIAGAVLVPAVVSASVCTALAYCLSGAVGAGEEDAMAFIRPGR